jgi:uncharacterized membrane protein YeaQ/YmgE (transglycosylase-associated protein family)
MHGLIGSIVGGVIFGAIIGGLGRLVLPGKQRLSLGVTVVIGLLGGVAGGLLAQLFGVGQTSGFDWIKTFFQVGFAAVGITIYNNMRGRPAA